MGELASSPPPTAVKQQRLQQQGAVVVSARPRLDDAADGCYALRRSRRGGRSRRDRKPKPKQPQQPETKKTILKRLSPTDLASSLTMFGAPGSWEDYDYEARLLRELQQRQREWYLLNATAPPPPADPHYFPLQVEAADPAPPTLLWSPTRARCRECDAAAAAMREPAFHRCVRDAVTVGFRSPVGPIERPATARKSSAPPSPSPSPPPLPSPGRIPAFLGGMPVY